MIYGCVALCTTPSGATLGPTCRYAPRIGLGQAILWTEAHLRRAGVGVLVVPRSIDPRGTMGEKGCMCLDLGEAHGKEPRESRVDFGDG